MSFSLVVNKSKRENASTPNFSKEIRWFFHGRKLAAPGCRGARVGTGHLSCGNDGGKRWWRRRESNQWHKADISNG